MPSVRDVLNDPRATGVARALPRTLSFMSRHRESGGSGGIGLAAQVFLDEVMISAMRNPRLFPHGEDFLRAGEDIRSAYEMWSEKGWLQRPEAYHGDPPAPDKPVVREERGHDHLTFRSGYCPHEGEPGRRRWMLHQHNRTAHAYLLRHSDGPRPWLVFFHGFGMGTPFMDFRAFRAQQLHADLGINILSLVLPLHGPRQRPGATRGEGFMSIDLVDSVHGLAQAAYDARSAIRWIRAQHGDVPVGVYGISLGGYVASLVASLEDGLACAIAGIPAVDLPDLFRRHATPDVRKRALEEGALGAKADAVHQVVSPLTLRPRLPRERRFIFAGSGDRMSTARQAKRLWEHWERPKIAWYPGGHIGFFMSSGVGRFVSSALEQSLSGAPPATGRVA